MTIARTSSRRTLLAGCGALPVLAGFFHPARRALAAAGPAPKRLLILGRLEGVFPNVWRPSGGETDFQLSDVMKPLDPWKAKLIVLDGVHNQTALNNGYGDTHAPGSTGVLTGNAMRSRPAQFVAYTAPSESLDQFLADKLRGPARLRSLEMTVPANFNDTQPKIVYPMGGGNPIIPLNRPAAAFDRLFSGVVAASGTSTATDSATAAQRLRARRASVLDVIGRQLERMRMRLPREDERKLQLHLDAIRDIEKQLVSVPVVTAGCAARPRPADAAPSFATLPETTRIQLDLIVQAFACDVTRVITFPFANDNWKGPAPFIGLTSGDLHGVSHGKGGGSWEALGPKIMRWTFEQQAYLLRALESVPEGDRTLLDNTLVLSIADMGDSGAHGYRNIPVHIVGSAGGYLRTGRSLNLGGRAHNDLLVTVANALGVAVDKFGDPALCAGGPLAALRA